MSKNKEIQCEYCTVRSNENKCKALKIEFHNCLNILEQKKCPIYKLKQQLKSKEQECEKLKNEKALRNAIKANHKYKQILDEIEKYLDAQQQYFDGEDYHNLLDIINKVKGNIND